MRCKGCDYPLWNLKARECPECGLAFRPSQFEFTLNAVRFCCPGCGQDYYGTGAKGHLVPEAFVCVSCARPVTMDECVLLPTAGVREEQTKADEMPWFERKRRGYVSAFFATVGRAMVAPGRLMNTIGEHDPSGFVYAAVINFCIILVSIFPLFVFGGAMGAAIGGGGGTRTARVYASMLGGFGIALVGSLVGVALLIALWVLLAHAILKLTGPTPFGMKRTCQAIGYSAGANALCGIPCLSLYFGWLFVIWWIVSAIVMLMKAQRVGSGRATAAVLVPPLVLGLGVGGWFAFMIYSGVSRATMVMPPNPTVAAAMSADVAAENMAAALIGWADTNSGAWPAHPFDLTRLSLLQEREFWPNSRIGAQGGRHLDGEPVAVREGDFVFTYFGINRVAGSPDLWLFVQYPDPGSTRVSPWTGPVYVGGLDGEVREYALGAEFDERLAMQNDLRAKAGLPPIPPPASVVIGQPVTR